MRSLSGHLGRWRLLLILIQIAILPGIVPARADESLNVESVAAAALANNRSFIEPNTLKRWQRPVKIHYISDCSLDSMQADEARLTQLNKFIAEIDRLNTSLAMSPVLLECQYEHSPAVDAPFGVAIIPGGGISKVREVLARGIFGDGSEILSASLNPENIKALEQGCTNSRTGKAGSHEIIAATIYADPHILNEDMNFCIKLGLMGILGFNAHNMPKNTESILSLSWKDSDLTDLDSCLIEILYSKRLRESDLQRPKFFSLLPQLIRESEHCQRKATKG